MSTSRKARGTLATTTIVSAVLLTACGGSEVVAPATPSASATVPAQLQSFYAQPVRWHNCGNADCATIMVPLDYANPSAGTTTLNMARIRQGDGELGSLVINPGGPGGSAFDYAKAATSVVNKNVLAHYDLIGVDPRGVGHSSPVTCLTEAGKDAFAEADATPDSAWERSETAKIARTVQEGCTASGNALIGHMSTEEAARDLDIVRSVLGDPVLNYLGKSWGTYLGATYAELFPDRVGRMVLDGVLDAGGRLESITRDQAVGFEAALRNFAHRCVSEGNCPLTGTDDEAVKQLQDFLTALDRRPIRNANGRELTESLATTAMLSSLYRPDAQFESLRDAIAAGMKGDAQPLLNLADAGNGRDSLGHYPTNATDAFYVYTCTDRPWSGTAQDAADLAEAWAADAPTFGPSLATGLLTCSGWLPQGAPRAPRAISTDASMLVVAATHDPATPLPWAQKLAEDLPNAHLITVESWGHTAYSQGSACVDEQVDNYLLAGKLPVQPTC